MQSSKIVQMRKQVPYALSFCSILPSYNKAKPAVADFALL